MERYPSPLEFPWGKPGFRDYSDEEVRKQFVGKFNPNITELYTAIHINILFGNGQITDIAEVQLMTREELKLAEERWPDYNTAQRRMIEN